MTSTATLLLSISLAHAGFTGGDAGTPGSATESGAPGNLRPVVEVRLKVEETLTSNDFSIDPDDAAVIARGFEQQLDQETVLRARSEPDQGADFVVEITVEEYTPALGTPAAGEAEGSALAPVHLQFELRAVSGAELFHGRAVENYRLVLIDGKARAELRLDKTKGGFEGMVEQCLSNIFKERKNEFLDSFLCVVPLDVSTSAAHGEAGKVDVVLLDDDSPPYLALELPYTGAELGLQPESELLIKAGMGRWSRIHHLELLEFLDENDETERFVAKDAASDAASRRDEQAPAEQLGEGSNKDLKLELLKDPKFASLGEVTQYQELKVGDRLQARLRSAAVLRARPFHALEQPTLPGAAIAKATNE